MKVMGVSGLPGSGKSLISKIAKKKGAIIINMGDIIRKEAIKRNKSSGETAVDLRKEQGQYVVAKLTIQEINSYEKNDEKVFLIEGIRSPYEVQLFKENFAEFQLISVFASNKLRFQRLKDRNRADDSDDFKIFEERDNREINFGINDVIANSDYQIKNENDLDSYEQRINEFFNKKNIFNQR
ncbi:adenylate kinase [Methanobrevibacter cuticularis]|uniref:Adenylate kinase n=1 Tax=Methanobrevibacter cuticularis TaxID=47311 RepID=A0A166CM80_9EURY|nr:AAA family ATPase [Methanobrevibacter cuticularis]KZX15407.1 adenylate kinase [Methanobrevibacter cuticularis]